MAISVEEKLNLIKRNTAEIIGENELQELLTKKNPVVYWGTAPTGKPHVGYFLPMLKIADFLKAGFKVKILLADLHASLDNTPWDCLEQRYEYYAKVIPLMIEAIGVNVKNLEVVRGSSYQLKPGYMFDVLKFSSFVSVKDANKAASEVVKLGDNPKLSGLIYPLMQVLDEQYLGADVQLGGTDQRKIMVLARENLPRLGYKRRIEVMNPLVPGLIGKKMSASNPQSKIDLLDDFETVKKKLNKADCVEGEPDNGVMAFVKLVIMTIKKDKKEKFVIERPAKWGGNIEYLDYETLEQDFVEKKLHPQDLKVAVAKEISNLLSVFEKHRKSIEEIDRRAYSV